MVSACSTGPEVCGKSVAEFDAFCESDQTVKSLPTGSAANASGEWLCCLDLRVRLATEHCRLQSARHQPSYDKGNIEVTASRTNLSLHACDRNQGSSSTVIRLTCSADYPNAGEKSHDETFSAAVPPSPVLP